MQSWERYSAGEIIGGQYELRQVYQGGMGIVFLCNDIEEKISFALKTFQDKYLATPSAKERFCQEAATWVELGYHNHVVHAEKVKTIDGKPYIILEAVLGNDGFPMNLARKLESGPLSLRETLKYGAQICLGFTYVQSIVPGLVHRDIKPSNILISHEDFAKITDFGIFTIRDGNQDISPGFLKNILGKKNRESGFLGTHGYMSPEQGKGGPLDIRSDIYAMGLLLYEMLTAENYWNSKEKSRGVDQLFKSIDSNSGAEIVELIRKCLADEPSNRYSSFVDLGYALVQVYQLKFGEPILFDHRVLMLPGLWHIVKDLSFKDAIHWITGKEKNGKRLSKDQDLSVKLNQQNYALLYDQALSLNEVGQYQKALEKFEKILDIEIEWASTGNFPEKEINEGMARILVNKANTLRRLRRIPEAIKTYEDALGYDDKHYNTWYNLAECRFNELHDLYGALSAYEKALSIKEDDFMAWNSKGFVHFELEEFEIARKCYERALELNPRFTITLGNMGVLLLTSGMTLDAKEYFLKITNIDPGNALGWYYLASIVFESDQTKALEYYRMAQRLQAGFDDQQLLRQVSLNIAARSK